MSRITISLRREAEIARFGPERIDDLYLDSNYHYNPHPLPGVSSAGSHTVLGHISVIPRSHRSSNASKRQTLVSGAPLPHSCAQPRRPQTRNALTRFLSHNLSHNRISRSFSAVDTVLSISPAHTEEAIEAERRHELAIARERERQLARDAKVPIISEHEPLSWQDAYELRTLRPSTAGSDSFFRL